MTDRYHIEDRQKKVRIIALCELTVPAISIINSIFIYTADSINTTNAATSLYIVIFLAMASVCGLSLQLYTGKVLARAVFVVIAGLHVIAFGAASLSLSFLPM